jgi:hypothetical protein
VVVDLVLVFFTESRLFYEFQEELKDVNEQPGTRNMGQKREKRACFGRQTTDSIMA